MSGIHPTGMNSCLNWNCAHAYVVKNYYRQFRDKGQQIYLSTPCENKISGHRTNKNCEEHILTCQSELGVSPCSRLLKPLCRTGIPQSVEHLSAARLILDLNPTNALLAGTCKRMAQDVGRGEF